MGVLSIFLKAFGAFILFFVLVFLLSYLWQQCGARKRRRQRAKRKEDNSQEKQGAKFRLNKMDVILIVIAATLVVFSLKMINLFETYMAVPDTLITCVFSVCGGECGFMGWIKTSKEKYQNRAWQLADEKRMEEAAKQAATPERNNL